MPQRLSWLQVLAQVGQRARLHLPLRRSNRRPHPDSPVRVVREGSKARAVPADKVCQAVSRARVVQEVRVCLAVRVAPALSRARVVRELRTAPPRRDPRTQLQRRRRQKTLLKALTPKILIPRLSNEELPVGVLDATMASGRPYFFS